MFQLVSGHANTHNAALEGIWILEKVDMGMVPCSFYLLSFSSVSFSPKRLRRPTGSMRELRELDLAAAEAGHGRVGSLPRLAFI